MRRKTIHLSLIVIVAFIISTVAASLPTYAATIQKKPQSNGPAYVDPQWENGKQASHAIHIQVTTNPSNLAIQYADSHWSWTKYDHSTDWACQKGDNIPADNCVQTADAYSPYVMQPNFQCAEFVSRALATEGLMPNLGSNDSQSAYGAYLYNGTYYDLWNTGTASVVGLYDFLINSGSGIDIGDQPTLASPGDVVFYYAGAVTPANREHVEILTSVGTTPGGSDTLADSHNFAGYHMAYANSGYYNSSGNFVPFARTIIHLKTNGSSGNRARMVGQVDFNGDGISDFVVYDNGVWTVKSGAPPYQYLVEGLQLGSATSIPFIGNFDGHNDFVVYDNGVWTVKSGAPPYQYLVEGLQLGGVTDVPLLGDFNGDGVNDFVIDSGGLWVVKSGAPPYQYLVEGLQLGGATDIPLIGKFDGHSDFVIDSGGQWTVKSGAPPYQYLIEGLQLGSATDVPLLGDFNGDGVSDFVIDSGGQWTVKSGVPPYQYLVEGLQLGSSTSIPLTN
jgi:hypothetical protein